MTIVPIFSVSGWFTRHADGAQLGNSLNTLRPGQVDYVPGVPLISVSID